MSSLNTNLYSNLANSSALNTKANATSSTSSSGDSGSAYDISNIGSTFMNLLTQELQNQDPTAPMDSTAMVGQMISLNQLSELASINQTLSGAASTSDSASSSALKDQTNAAAQNVAGSASTLAMMFPASQLPNPTATGATNTASTGF